MIRYMRAMENYTYTVCRENELWEYVQLQLYVYTNDYVVLELHVKKKQMFFKVLVID